MLHVSILRCKNPHKTREKTLLATKAAATYSGEYVVRGALNVAYVRVLGDLDLDGAHVDVAAERPEVRLVHAVHPLKLTDLYERKSHIRTNTA